MAVTQVQLLGPHPARHWSHGQFGAAAADQQQTAEQVHPLLTDLLQQAACDHAGQ